MIQITDPIVQFVNVGVELDSKPRLSGISFAIARGAFVYLHGQTGCGKSLVLKLIAGLATPTTGEVRVAGDAVNTFNDLQRRQLRRSIGIMSQEGLLLKDRTVFENVMLPTLAAGESYKEAKRRATEALTHCHIADLADYPPQELSYGQRQIACLARAVVNSPKLILADEPAAHLDMENAQQLMNLLGDFSLRGVPVIVASHLNVQPENIAVDSLKLTPTGVEVCD